MATSGPAKVSRADVRLWRAVLLGAFLLLRVFSQGYKGKAHEIGIERSDVPKAVAGKV